MFSKTKFASALLAAPLLFGACSTAQAAPWDNGNLKVSADGRYLQHTNGTGFFWLGDTCWDLFNKMTRDEVIAYLNNRQAKGFNVIQATIHGVTVTNKSNNRHGDMAFQMTNGISPKPDITRPITTSGSNPSNATEYDYWDHVDFVLTEAEKRGMYIALLPTWALYSIERYSDSEFQTYGTWIANRYKARKNIIWVSGGDVRPTSTNVSRMRALGNAINSADPNHLITFHPGGQAASSTWYHSDSWMDFNMIQSGHRRYIAGPPEQNVGDLNYRYVTSDRAKTPAKPTLDAESAYEDHPINSFTHANEGRWQDDTQRRKAYWPVFAGAFGHTYGHNNIWQVYTGSAPMASAPENIHWTSAMNRPGAGQMQYLKKLMESRPWQGRVPDQGLIASGQGTGNNYITATRGNGYAMIYTFTGNTFSVNMGKISGSQVKAYWYNPRTGTVQTSGDTLGTFSNTGTRSFNPPGSPGNGNDWVLVLDDTSKNYPLPGNGTPTGCTTNCGTGNTPIVVSMKGIQADGVYANYKVWVNNNVVGQGATTGDFKDYTFNTSIAPSSISSVRVEFLNDNGVRDMFVKSVKLGSNAATPSTASNVKYDKGALDGKDVINGQVAMYWAGNLIFSYSGTGGSDDGGTTTNTPIVANMRGVISDNIAPFYKIWVNGSVISQGSVTPTSKDYTFTAPVAASSIRTVYVEFTNDNGPRDLYVNSVKVGSRTTTPANASNVKYDRFALDGVDVMPGQSAMGWRGFLIFSY